MYARRKFGGEANACGALAHVAAVGEGDGIRFDFGRVASAPNTVDAHRLILYVGEPGRGAQWKLADALFEAYLSNGLDLNDREQLAKVAAGIGLDADEVLGYLAGDGGKSEVRAAQENAYARGIQGVPFYAFDGGRSVSGAQPVELSSKPSTAREPHAGRHTLLSTAWSVRRGRSISASGESRSFYPL